MGIGSLLAAVHDPGHDRFRTVAKLGSGLSEAAWKALRVRLDRDATEVRPRRVDSIITPDVWVTPRIVVEVRADEITRCKGARGQPAGVHDAGRARASRGGTAT